MTDTPAGCVTGHNLISCIGELSSPDYDDLNDCTRIATRSADLVSNRHASSPLWLEEYVRTLQFLGWKLYEGSISTRISIDVCGTLADLLVKRAQTTQDRQQGNAMIDTLDALQANHPATHSLDTESLKGRRFQVLPARYDKRGNLDIAVFNIELKATIEKSNFLFWSWEEQSAKIIQSRAFLKLDRDKLDQKRPLMESKLREHVMKRFALRKQQP